MCTYIFILRKNLTIKAQIKFEGQKTPTPLSHWGTGGISGFTVRQRRGKKKLRPAPLSN